MPSFQMFGDLMDFEKAEGRRECALHCSSGIKDRPLVEDPAIPCWHVNWADQPGATGP
jgi:hypothetical protein